MPTNIQTRCRYKVSIPLFNEKNISPLGVYRAYSGVRLHNYNKVRSMVESEWNKGESVIIPAQLAQLADARFTEETTRRYLEFNVTDTQSKVSLGPADLKKEGFTFFLAPTDDRGVTLAKKWAGDKYIDGKGVMASVQADGRIDLVTSDLFWPYYRDVHGLSDQSMPPSDTMIDTKYADLIFASGPGGMTDNGLFPDRDAPVVYASGKTVEHNLVRVVGDILDPLGCYGASLDCSTYEEINTENVARVGDRNITIETFVYYLGGHTSGTECRFELRLYKSDELVSCCEEFIMSFDAVSTNDSQGWGDGMRITRTPPLLAAREMKAIEGITVRGEGDKGKNPRLFPHPSLFEANRQGNPGLSDALTAIYSIRYYLNNIYTSGSEVEVRDIVAVLHVCQDLKTLSLKFSKDPTIPDKLEDIYGGSNIGGEWKEIPLLWDAVDNSVKTTINEVDLMSSPLLSDGKTKDLFVSLWNYQEWNSCKDLVTNFARVIPYAERATKRSIEIANVLIAATTPGYDKDDAYYKSIKS